jgi:AGCS family alanine or glycine:cation symporter
MLGWYYYGQSALAYLSGGRKWLLSVYQLLFIACALLGSVMELRVAWAAADLLNALMALPNILALFLLRKKITIPPKRMH